MTARRTATDQVLILKDFPEPSLARLLSPNGRAHWAHKRTAARVQTQGFV